LVKRIRLSAFVCLLLAITARNSLATEPPRDRRAFVEAMNRVKVSMWEAEVLALVGKPDDVTTSKDWGGWGFGHTQKVWRYGAAGHMAAATLGQLGIDADHRIAWVTGQGTPPPEGMFTEPELRNLLETLHDLPSQKTYRARPLIRAVNLLQPLEKKKALAAIDEFVRVSSDRTDHVAREGLFLLLRTLFEVPSVATIFPDEDAPSPPGFMPPIYCPPEPDWPADKKLLPRFPVVIVGGIPFLIVRYGGCSGPPQMPESHLEYYRKYGTLRAKPLSPTAKPFTALEAFKNSPRWYFKFKNDRPPRDEEERADFEYKRDLEATQAKSMANQLLDLLDTVHRFEPDPSGAILSTCCNEGQEQRNTEAENRKIIAEASKLAVRWDAKNSRYTFLDETFVISFDPKLHPAKSWGAAVGDVKLEFVVRRDSRHYVDLKGYDLRDEEGSPAKKRKPDLVVRVFDVKAKDKLLFETNECPRGYLATLRLEEARGMQIEVVVGKQTLRGPVLKP
jgi:hypothetical protein